MRPPDYEPNKLSIEKQLELLRQETHRTMWVELSDRKEKRPMPTEEEIWLGTYLEFIEPQVRAAVREFNRRGYGTNSSGFFRGMLQDIDGNMNMTIAEIAAVEAVGATVESLDNGYCYVSFKPSVANVKDIEHQWQAIATALPDRGERAMPSFTIGANDFRCEIAAYIFADSARWRSLGEAAFIVFNDVINKRTTREYNDRKALEQPPSQDELDIGVFREHLPVHVRDAVFAIRHKGYNVESYQTNRPHCQEQVLAGHDLIQNIQEQVALENCNMRVVQPYSGNKNYQHIIYTATEVDVQLLAEQWAKLATNLPDRGQSARPASNLAADVFRKKFEV